jgi:hypothetical protein
MASNIINLKSPNGEATVSVSKDMEEYYLKMGYTKVNDAVKKPISMFSNKAKQKIKKEENK